MWKLSPSIIIYIYICVFYTIPPCKIIYTYVLQLALLQLTFYPLDSNIVLTVWIHHSLLLRFTFRDAVRPDLGEHIICYYVGVMNHQAWLLFCFTFHFFPHLSFSPIFPIFSPFLSLVFSLYAIILVISIKNNIDLSISQQS